ncbi:diacylglycerol kinase family protein [Dongia sp.]|uniref:diacylglycerol/lipid kinase family protein n=1 Tax=Dongia sp. TaxID=1977262 RepID=UPI0035B145BB
MPAAPRLTIIFNPIAGRRRRGFLEDVTDRLVARGWAIELKATEARGDAESLARAIASLPKAERPDLLAVAGGDGTIGEAINGLIASGSAEPMPFGIIPMGTANVLAAEIGLEVSAEAVAATLDARHARPIFVGRAHSESMGSRAFTLMAGAGFDAHVVAQVDGDLKRRIGKLAYVWQSLRQMTRFRFPIYRVSIDGGAAIEVASVIVAKGHFYGGHYVVAPAARLDLAQFEICLFEKRGAFHALRYALALGMNRLPRAIGYRIVSGRHVTIEGPPGDPVQGDGDVIGHLPMTIDLAPQPLSLVMPRAR